MGIELSVSGTKFHVSKNLYELLFLFVLLTVSPKLVFFNPIGAVIYSSYNSP